MSNQLRPQQSSSLQTWTPKQQESLDLARNIVSGGVSISVIENSLSVTDTIHCSTIRGVFKGEAGSVAFGVVKLLTGRFLASFGFSTKHSDMQVEMITTDILDNFKYESLEDIIIFLKMARQGKLGTTNRGIDSNLIIGEWMPAYLEIKSTARENDVNKKSREVNSMLSGADSVIKSYTQKNVLTQKEREKQEFTAYVEKMTKGITRDQLEMLIEKCSQIPEVAPYMYIMKLKRREIK